MVALLRAADAVRRFVAQAIAPHGITLQQYNVLRILRGAGPEGLPTLEIGARLIEQTPGTTRLVDQLIRRGLVERERCAEDRRVIWCRITSAGLELLSVLDPVVRSADRAAVGSLTEDEQQMMASLLDRARPE